MISDLYRYDIDRMQPGIVILALVPFWYLGHYIKGSGWDVAIFAVLSGYLGIAQSIFLDDLIRLLLKKEGRDHLREFWGAFSEVRVKVKLALALWIFGIPLHWYLLFQTPVSAHEPMIKAVVIMTVLMLLREDWFKFGKLRKKRR